MVAAGGEVWFGDEMTVRECPRARALAHRHLIPGRNGRRVIHGALNAATGDFVSLIRERSRQDDCTVFVQALGAIRPQTPKVLIWDNAPPHHPKRVAAAAEAVRVHIAWLPFRSPELNPEEILWRLAKAVVAANRLYRVDQQGDSVQHLAEQAMHHIEALSPVERLRCSGLLSPKFQWLSTWTGRELAALFDHRPRSCRVEYHA